MKTKELIIIFSFILTVLKVKAALTQEQKDDFLNIYMKNRYRGYDTNKNLKELYWDDELANDAQVIIFKWFL